MDDTERGPGLYVTTRGTYRLVGVGGVFRSYSVGTWDSVNAPYFLVEE